jgi:hypothetical protein
MINRKLIAGTAALAVAAVGGGNALAAKPAPKTATIKAIEKDGVKINRYFAVGLRWKRDNYSVRSGGTLRLVNDAPDNGPHSFSIVKKKDRPRTLKQLNNCKVCNQLAEAHGADPNSQGPPKYPFLENGKGQDTPPDVDRPGDSALLGPNKGDVTELKVTAKKGKTLYAICIIHPWMQTKVHVR